jgi:hypothetical protein
VEIERFRARHAPGLDPGVDTDSRKENASKQDGTSSLNVEASPKRLINGLGADWIDLGVAFRKVPENGRQA